MAELDIAAIMAAKPEGVDDLEWRALKGVDVAPPAAPGTQVIPLSVVHTSMGGSYPDGGYITNMHGTAFAVAVNELLANSNVTWVDGWVVPAGQGFPDAPTFRFNPVNKLDSATIFPSGHDLILAGLTHTLGFPAGQPRPINWELGRVVGAWDAGPEWFAQFGGEGVVIVPVTPEDIDYNHIQQIVESVVGASASDSLVNKITAGHASVRTSMREIAKQALVYLMNPANYNDPGDPDHLAKKFQDEYYQYNANLQYGQLNKFGNEVGYKPPRTKVGQFVAKVMGK